MHKDGHAIFYAPTLARFSINLNNKIMRKINFTFLIAILMSMVGTNAFAYDAVVDGIYYNLSSSGTATVTYYSSYSSNTIVYKGDIAIPESVTYNNKTYKVTSIGQSAFRYCSDLTSVSIPSSVTSIGEKAFNNCSGLISVTIPNSVTNIGNSAFSGCSGLTSVTIPNSVTNIGNSAFSGCSGLTSVIIPSNVNSIGNGAFSSCTKLANVTLNSNSIVSANRTSSTSLKTIFGDQVTNYVLGENVTSIGDYVFYSCSGLTSVTIPNNVTSIGSSAFYGCDGLTSITIPNNVTTIGSSAFQSCSGLTSVTIPNSVTSIGNSAFDGCSGLTSVTIPNSVTSIGSSAFSYCRGLTSVTIPNSVTNIGSSAFRYCSGLTSITIPNNVTSIGSSAFYGCESLTSITIGSNVTSIGSSAFYNCSNLTNVKVLVTDLSAFCNNKVIGLISSYIGKPVTLIDKDGNEIKEYVIPEDVTSIGEEAFYYCSGLTSITIPNSVTSIGRSAFYNCSGLTSVTISSNVTSIGSSAFNNCSNLTNAKVPVTNFTEFCNNKVIGLISSYIEKPVTLIDKDGNEIKEYVIPEDVTGIGEKAFYNCSGLTSVTIPNSVTSIGNSAFYGCSGLTSVIIPSNVNSIGNGAFSSCTKLANVTLNSNSIVSAKRTSSTSFKSIFGEQVTNYVLGENVTSIGDYAFYSCSGLTSFIIPNSVTNIGISAFRYCSGLTSVTISSNVTSIGSSAFNNCSNLTNVKVPVTNFTEFCNNKVIGLISSYGKPVTLINKDGNEIKEYVIPEDVTTIGEKAFYNCSGITSVTIPSSVTSIGNSAFSGCSGLTSVIIPINVTSIGNGAFSSCTKLANVTLNSNSIVSAKRTSSTSFKSIFGDQVTNYILGDNVTAIGERAFYNCSGLTSVTIPNSVTSIDYSAFSECDQLSSVTLGDDITSIASSAFPSKTKFYTKHKTKTLFSLWNGSYKKIYEQETSKSLAPPSLDLKTSTQTSVTLEIINMYSEYTYEHSGKKVTSNTIEVNNLCPEYSTSYSVNVKYNDLSYTCSGSFTTKSISPKVTASNLTASSATIKGSYTEGDASVTSEKLIINNVEYDGNEKFVKGLNPNTTYTIRYVIEVTYGTGQKQTYNTTYRSGYSTLDRNFKTEALTLTTKQPKVVSLGNVIVSAEANVDDEEKNVGFEWRRTDWTDDFESNTGTANMVEGTMEGYIRNLNTEKLWKFRPYYLADNGTYYYGDWVGVDPTNISFFEPTVHTYDKIVVNGNTALVKGYALGGSDDVTVQGFKYWKSAGGGSNRVSSTDIPDNAKTIEASGTVMEVSLSDLDYDSSYSYVAFATTSKGTYYGEIKTFETGNDPTGINTIKMDNTSTEGVHEIARFNMQGRRIATPEKGINIVKMSDGTTKKVLVK